MTREEAIEILKDTPFICPSVVDIDGAINMAISALEQMETVDRVGMFAELYGIPKQEPCDTISRKAVKKWICKTCPDDSECQRDCDVIKGIDALPSVQPSRKGHYTEEELRQFADGISLSLCSKRSAQHWKYDEKTAEQIRWLECLHSKVMTDIADMRGAE